MVRSLRRWRPFHLLLAWMAYWATLAAITMGPGLLAAWRATRAEAGKGSIGAGIDDGIANFTVTLDGATLWRGMADVGTIALWVAGPPALLWIAWLMSRPRRGATTENLPVR